MTNRDETTLPEGATDPRLMALPSPQRLDIERFFEAHVDTPVWALWREKLLDPERSLDQVINELRADPFSRRYAALADAGQESFNAGNLTATLSYLRYKLHGSRQFQTRDSLEPLLHATDIIGPDTPCRYLTLPYPSVFFEFGEHRLSPFRMHHPMSGDHIVEGAYAHQSRWIAGDASGSDAVAAGILEAGASFRVLDIIFTGSPVGKAHYMDDCTLNISLYIGDEEESIETVLDRTRRANNARPGARKMTAADMEHALELTTHLVKILLYLNCTAARTRMHPEATELRERMERAGAAKQAKLQRKLARAYDRILIGPEAGAGAAVPGGGNGQDRDAHWRRGHFRNQAYGERWQQHKLIWLEPQLIRADRIGDAPPPGKRYVLR